MEWPLEVIPMCTHNVKSPFAFEKKMQKYHTKIPFDLKLGRLVVYLQCRTKLVN